MTPEEINKKAYEKYPVWMDTEYDKYGNAEEIDLNEKARNAYAAGMLAERERQMKEAAYFPEYDSIVNKVFGAGNLESWELDEAKRLVRLAKDELLKDLASGPTIKGWVARDENGQLWLYGQMPYRNETVWTTNNGRYFIRIDPTIFPDLRWEDEPIEVELPIIIRK